MMYLEEGQSNFISEMSERQISTTEFFSNVLLDSLERNFGLKNALILCFDTEGKFLSWTSKRGTEIDSEDHPYHDMAEMDTFRQMIYREAVRDDLTYFNTDPRIYRISDYITKEEYDKNPVIRFLEDNFCAHYCASMAFGIHAYIQIIFFKSFSEGDFSDSEMEHLKKIYGYVAASYKNFKKHEQAKIISNIQDEIISSGESAYLITDDFMHIMSYNQRARQYLTDILGSAVQDQMDYEKPCLWLPFLLENGSNTLNESRVETKVIKNMVFKIYTYDQSYSHGIIDRYHWITISKQKEETEASKKKSLPLTQTEWKVARLLNDGLTYQKIADEMMVSYHTVKNHVQNIFSKCGIRNRYQLYRIFSGEEEDGK